MYEICRLIFYFYRCIHKYQRKSIVKFFLPSGCEQGCFTNVAVDAGNAGSVFFAFDHGIRSCPGIEG